MSEQQKEIVDELEMFQNALYEYNALLFSCHKAAELEQGFILRILCKEHNRLLSQLKQ